MPRFRLLLLSLCASLPAIPAKGASATPLFIGEIVAVRGDTVVVRAKDPLAAFAMSVLPSACGVLIGGVAGANGLVGNALEASALLMVVGPSAGQFYARNNGGALVGVGTRALGAGMIFGAAVSTFSDYGSCEDDPSCMGGDNDFAGPLLVGGAALFAVGTLYSVFDAPAAARRYNRRAGLRLSFTPVVGAQRGVRLAVQL